MRTIAAVAAASALLSGCVNTVDGVAARDTTDPITVENFTDSLASSSVRSVVTDVVSFWEANGVNLSRVRFVQWDSGRNEEPMMCKGSVYQQPSYCPEGWIAWDVAWARKALRHGDTIATVYASRAVSDAVAHTVTGVTSDMPSISAQECLVGTYMAMRSDAISKELRAMLTDVSAFVKGLESRNPMQDCISL